MNISFDNNVVVITGAAGGLGAAMAKLFAENSAKVAVCDLRGAEKVAEEIELKGGVAKGYNFDITNMDAVGDAMEQIHNDLGNIKVLVNNAGINVLYC